MSEFNVEEILEAIHDDEGNNALDDINSLIDMYDEDLDRDERQEIYKDFLEDMVTNGHLDDEHLHQIYELIPEGAIYEYPVTNEDGSITQAVAYYNTPDLDPYTTERAATALIADALQKSQTFERQFVDGAGSDYSFYTEFVVISPGFVITTYIEKTDAVGFFAKQFPDDEHLKYNFNIDDESLFCVFSALFKQDPDLYYLCEELPPSKEEERDFYLRVVTKCGINATEVFAITTTNVIRVYKKFGEAYKLNLNITYYYLKSTPNINDERTFNRKTIAVRGNPNSEDIKRLTVAKLADHMFNINMGETKRKDALLYLQKIGNIYDTLKDRKLRSKLSEVTKLSRDHAKEFRTYQREQLLNPDELLHDIVIDDCVEDPKFEHDELGTDKAKIKYIPFVFDYETILNNNREHCVYSYVIKKIESNVTESFFNSFPLEQEASNKLTNPLIKLFTFVIRNTKEDERAILFAHNGSRFDNLISLKLASETHGMSSFREVTAGPNNDIMLSLDITYNYKEKRTDRQCKKKVISFRDSYKLLDCKAADIPENYGIKDFKLPYCYQLYNNMFEDVYKEKNKSQMKNIINNYFKSKDNNRFVTSKNTPDEKTLKSYERIYNGEILNDDLSAELKDDIQKYRALLKKKNVYYLPEQYCLMYNKYDVLVVEQGLLKMQEYIRSLNSIESIMELIDSSTYAQNENNRDTVNKLKDRVKSNNMCIPITKDLDIFQYRSLASMVFDIAKKGGIFDNIYQLTGNLKKFVQLSVVGGKVMKNPDEKKSDYRSKFYEFFMSKVGQVRDNATDKEILEKALLDSIIDNDAVSLYPSAISLCKMPAGKPDVYSFKKEKDQIDMAKAINKLIRVCSNKDNQERHFYCVDITTRKDLEYPILSEKDENGIRRFKNGSFHKLVVGDVALADAIKYQDAEVTKIYSFVRFKSSCDRFANFIKTLFTLRLVFKTIKLPCQNAIKLIMNSSYGRTILKQSHYKKVYKRVSNEQERKDFVRFLSKNYFYLKPEMIKLGMFVKLQKRELFDNPKGYPHVGSYILEMSKQLMNKMFNSIYNNNMIVYYTDTDSIHVKAESLNKLGDMIGEDMTQFHSDFGEKGYRGVYCPELGKSNPGIFAIRSLFVMKKCYYDKLFCINNETNKYTIIEHKRTKGITSEFMSEEKYKKLLDGEMLTCDMCEYRDLVLRKTKQGALVSMSSFKRTITKTD